MLDFKENFNEYKLLVSPMIRTKHTMQILQEILGLIDKEYIEEKLIAETDAGIATNMLDIDTKNKYPTIHPLKYRDRKYPEGESNLDAYNRVIQFYKKYKNEKNLIIVSHSGIIKFLTTILLNKSIDDLDFGGGLTQNYFYTWNNRILTQF